MSDVQIAVGLRRETGMHRVIHPFRQVLIDHLLDEIAGSLCFSAFGIFRIRGRFRRSPCHLQFFIAHIPDLSSSKHRVYI